MKNKFFSVITAITLTFSTLVGVTTFGYDPDGDGYYNVYDIILLRSFLSGNQTVSNLTALDYNKSGVITSTDVQKLTDDILSGPIDTSNPQGDNSSVPEYNFTETSRNYFVFDANTGFLKQGSDYTINNRTSYNNGDVATCDIIGDTDERIVDFSKSGVVKIIVSNQSGTHFGTGFIVGPHVIATAAHVLDDTRYSRKAVVNDIIAFNADGTQRTDSITPVETHHCSLFDNNSVSDYYDYALITVEEDLSNYPIFELGVYDNMLDKDVTATITGFPGQIMDNSTGNLIRVNNGTNLHTMYSGNGIVVSSDGGKINHNIDSSTGNSGGPLYVTEYYNNSMKYVAFGIHNLGTDMNDENNHAVHIDPNIICFYKNNPNIP